MDSDQGKLFIGGISWETSEEKLRDYFSNYGEVLQTVVMRDKVTARPRGFGFVVFADPSVLDAVLDEKHTIDGRTVEAKRALTREEQQTSTRVGSFNPSRSNVGSGSVRTKKIFVGGLPPTLTEDGFRQYFEAFGPVTDVVIMYDQSTQRPRGFGFISFETEDAVEMVLQKTFHDLNGKQVEVKKALPKDSNTGGGSRSMNGGGSGGYQGYSGGDTSGYDGRIDSSRYMQSQNTGGGYPSYGSSGYTTPGYGPASNAVAYGGYGSYGNVNSGYGGPAGAAYGNQNIAGSGYGSSAQAAARTPWSSQAASGYGAIGYGSGGGGLGLGPTLQSPSGATGYGNQGYGYGGYGANDGSYSIPSGYGAVGGRLDNNTLNSNGPAGAGELQGSGGSYMGNGYGDTGYGNAGWRSDPSQANGPQAGYGGGYGAGQPRHGQQ